MQSKSNAKEIIKILERKFIKDNKYFINYEKSKNNMKKIKLTQGQVALVDDEDYEGLSQYKWHAKYIKSMDSYYAARQTQRINGKQSTIRMQRYIMEIHGHDLSGKVVDHINHNTVDNTKNNLRVCDYSQNSMNRLLYKSNKSGLKGISEVKIRYKNREYIYWRARIQYNNKSLYLGLFKNKENAYKVYCEASLKYHGEFAKLN